MFLACSTGNMWPESSIVQVRNLEKSEYENTAAPLQLTQTDTHNRDNTTID